MQTPPVSPYLYLLLHLWASEPVTNTHINTPKQTHWLTHKESQAEDNGAKGLCHSSQNIYSLVQQHKIVFMSVSAIYDFCEAMSAIQWPPYPLWQLWSFNGFSFPSCIMRRLQVVAFLRGLTWLKNDISSHRLLISIIVCTDLFQLITFTLYHRLLIFVVSIVCM